MIFLGGFYFFSPLLAGMSNGFMKWSCSKSIREERWQEGVQKRNFCLAVGVSVWRKRILTFSDSLFQMDIDSLSQLVGPVSRSQPICSALNSSSFSSSSLQDPLQFFFSSSFVSSVQRQSKTSEKKRKNGDWNAKLKRFQSDLAVGQAESQRAGSMSVKKLKSRLFAPSFPRVCPLTFFFSSL